MDTADILIHVHPELDMPTRMSLQRNLTSHIGVDCAEFAHLPHPHLMVVKYDPDAIESMDILNEVRQLDPVATMVGL